MEKGMQSMSNIKQHFFLILPLVALLFAFECFLIVSRAVETKEDKLSQNYSIVIASKQKLSLDFIKQNIPEAMSIEPIDPSFVLDKIRTNMNNEDYENVKKQLSLYYNLKLESFPNLKRLEKIESTLAKIPSIIKAESFSKTHNQTYRLLFLVKFSTQLFAVLIAILSLLLMIDQIHIWHFEHHRRIEIMGYMGAGFWLKNRFFFRNAIYDALISTCVIIIVFLYGANTSMAESIVQALELQKEMFRFAIDFMILLFTSLLVCLSSVIVAILLQRRA